LRLITCLLKIPGDTDEEIAIEVMTVRMEVD